MQVLWSGTGFTMVCLCFVLMQSVINTNLYSDTQVHAFSARSRNQIQEIHSVDLEAYFITRIKLD